MYAGDACNEDLLNERTQLPDHSVFVVTLWPVQTVALIIQSSCQMLQTFFPKITWIQYIITYYYMTFQPAYEFGL